MDNNRGPNDGGIKRGDGGPGGACLWQVPAG